MTFSPTIVKRMPLPTTKASASGSTHALNSAYGVTLPRSVEPPIHTISRMRAATSGRSRSRIATLVIGPVATIATGSSEASRVSAMSSVAVRGSSGIAGSGSAGPPRPFSPWIHSAVSSVRAIGPAAPAATGTPVTPATVSAMRALRLVCSIGTLPPTVVTASSSSDGCPAASHSPKTSSCPGSQSTMTGTVMRAPAPPRGRPTAAPHRAARTSRPCRATAPRARPRRPRIAGPRRAVGLRRGTRRGPR